MREYFDLDWDSELKQCTGDVEMMWSVIKHRLLEGVYKYVPTTLPFASSKKDKYISLFATSAESKKVKRKE